MESVKEKQKKSYKALREQFGYTNHMASPRIEKVVISAGTGKATRVDKSRNDFVAERLTYITGQKAGARPARKSIASFKIREGEPIGYSVTLRKHRMYDFLDRFFNIALPRTRDFQGIDKKSVDDIGNLTIGIREHNIFPETADEELKDIFGLAVTIVTTASSREEAIAFFESLGVPFKK